jgi:hypothetical protein
MSKSIKKFSSKDGTVKPAKPVSPRYTTGSAKSRVKSATSQTPKK